jgi:hypothetical protein
VYDVHEWSEVRRLYDREHLNKAAIARRLGMSRPTVIRLLELDEPPRYEREPAGSKLDAHTEAIAAMLDRDPTVPATVILEHLRSDGYAGGITILKERVARLRPAFLQPRSFQRTTYLPGELAHGDWWQTGSQIPVGGGATREAYGWVTTLPHSAAHAVVFSLSKTMADFLQAALGCFEEERHRRRGVPALGDHPWQLRGIRGRVKSGATDALARGPRRPRKDAQVSELEREVERTSRDPQRARHREHPASGKSRWGLIGPIRGVRLAAGIKCQIVRAVHEAATGGMSVKTACEVLMLDPRQLRLWIRGGSRRRSARLSSSTARPWRSIVPTPCSRPSARRSDMRPPRTSSNTCATASSLTPCRARAGCSARSPRFFGSCDRLASYWPTGGDRVHPGPGPSRTSPSPTAPGATTSRRSQPFTVTITSVSVLDACSRKIVGRHFSPEATSEAVQSAWASPSPPRDCSPSTRRRCQRPRRIAAPR